MRGLFKKMYFSKVQRNFSTFGLGLIALSTAAVLSACSDTDKTAGGGPSGTDAGNAIMAQLTVDGQPAAFARVKLSESESLDATDNEFTEADSNGKIVFENVAEGTYTLEARLDGKALQKEVSVEGSDVDLGKEALEETVSIAGSVGEGA